MKRRFLPAAALAAAACLAVLADDPKPDDWKVPSRAAKKVNPVAADAKSLEAGKKVYERECLACHGAAGKGDGPQAKGLERQPGDLTSSKVREQSDGALFWKITEGRKPMPTYTDLLNDDQRWQVVVYMRSLAPADAVKETVPEFTVPDAAREAISKVLAATFAAGAALARDASDDATWAKCADAVAKIKEFDAKTLDEKARDPWTAAATAIAGSMKDAAELPARRAVFKALSEALAAALRKFGHAEAKAVRVFTCPLAFDKAGATWLQLETEALNPYLGAASPACGKSTETLAAKKP